MKPVPAFILCSLLAVGSAFASRNSAPVLPPGQAGKVTRADFKEKEEKEKEREDKEKKLEDERKALEESLKSLEDLPEDTEEERAAKEQERAAKALELEAKRLEAESIEAARQADKQAQAALKAQAPEDFIGDAKKVEMTAAPKAASVHETVVQQATVVAAATKVVARRSR
jgi:hypothetical protein